MPDAPLPTSIVTENGDTFVARLCDDCNGLVLEHHVSGREEPELIDLPPEISGWLVRLAEAYAEVAHA